MSARYAQIPLQRILRLKSGDFISADQIEPEGQYPVYGGNGLRGFTDRWNTEGPIVLVGRQGAHCGNVHIAPSRCWVSEHALRCFPDRVYSTVFIRYALETLELNRYSVSAAQPGLSTDNIKPLLIAFPHRENQKRIAAFLDEKTERIDALIQKKRALLDRLAEKRQAIITHAVTKGLNPAAPMKDSGIDWLGKIPAHWEVIALNKVTTKITNGYVGPTRDLFVDEGIRYIQSLHIKSNRIIFGDDFFVEEEWSHQHSKSILKTGDVLVVQTGDIGQVAYVPAEYEGCNCHALIICTPVRDELDGRFLAWLFNSDYGQEFLHLVKTGALHPHLNCGNVKFFSVMIPPPGEQRDIAGYLEDKREKIEMMTSKIRTSINKLVEYRSSLIAAAVIGELESSNGD